MERARRKFDRRQFLKLAAGSAVGSALAAACVPVPTPSPAAPSAPVSEAPTPTLAPPAEEVTVVFWSTEGDNAFGNLERGLITPYRDQYPNVNLKWEEVPWDPYYDKYVTTSAAGQAPDIAFVSAGWIQAWISLGIVLNLDPFIEGAGLFKQEDADKYFLNVLDGLRFPAGGSLYAIPFEWVTLVLYHNKSIFDAAGEPYPTNDWTYDKFLEVAQRLTRRSGDTVEVYGTTAYWDYSNLDSPILANGGRLLSDDYTKTLLDSPENVETVQWWVDLVRKHNVTPPAETFINSDPIDFFASGNVAMAVFGVWAIETFRAQENFEWDITVLPKGKVKQTAIQWGNQYAINSKSKVPDEAFNLALLAVSPDRPADSMGAGKVPVVKALAYSDTFLEKGKAPENKKAILETGDLSSPAEFGKRWDEWRTAMDQEMQLSFLGERPVPESIKAAAAAIQAVLDRP